MILISLGIYVAIAASIVTLVMFYAECREERIYGAGVAMTWPAWAIIATLFLPVWIGVGAYYLIQTAGNRINKKSVKERH
jgi:hypothetical protein